MNEVLAEAIKESGYEVKVLVSGAGHDAGVMATVAPTALLFVRSPGGISHSPDEAVTEDDVATAIRAMVEFVTRLAASTASTANDQ